MVRWDISLALNMTYFFLHVILNDSEESHNLSEEYMLHTFSVGYFACAQYDVLFLHVILNDSEESHRVSEEYILYGKPPSREIAAPAARKDSISGLSIVRWNISLTLNMTFFFIFLCEPRA